MIIDPAGKYSVGGSGAEKLQEPRSAGEQGLGGTGFARRQVSCRRCSTTEGSTR